MTVIERPVEEAFAVVQDATKTPLWEPGLPQVRRTSEGPFGVGATMVDAGTFLGRQYESPAACTSFAENKQFAAATTGAVLSRGRPDGGAGRRQRLMFHYRGESRGFVKLAEPLVVRLTKRQVQAAAGNLKALREQNALEP